MNITSLFIVGAVLFIMGIAPWDNKKLSREFVEFWHFLLIILGIIVFCAGLCWAMCVY